VNRRLQIVNDKLLVGPAVEDLSAVRDIVAGLPEQEPAVDTAAIADTPRVGSWDDTSAVLASVQKSGRVRVRVITWNMQAKAPPSIETLRAELFPDEKVRTVPAPPQCIESTHSHHSKLYVLFFVSPALTFAFAPVVSHLCHW